MNALDTNVWLYSHDHRDPGKQAIALQLIASARPLALPWQVGCEFVAASRKLRAAGFTEAQAWTALKLMQALADVVLLPVPDLWPETQLLQGPLFPLLLGRPLGLCLSARRRDGPLHGRHRRGPGH